VSSASFDQAKTAEYSTRIMSNWLYQFWLFSFNTAKHWGEGPRYWKAQNLGLIQNDEQYSVLSTGQHKMVITSPSASLEQPGPSAENVCPSQLCRWSIHISQENYETIPSPPPEPFDEPKTSSSMRPWPETWHHPPFEERLRDNLMHHDFSSINRENLPLAVGVVGEAAERSQDQLLIEALGFSIMGRNPSLVANILRKAIDAELDLEALYPLHLATTYLDGSKSCCQVLHLIGMAVGDDRKSYINELGHTVLDNIMITILKNHSSIKPGIVDDALRGELHFSGEQASICGRWDADSDCYRALLASGISTIPFAWKHKFCHTSIQVVCHCIELLASYAIGGFLESTPSGLFLKHCPCCGMKLQLLPLHTLVLTAFYLGNDGCEDEDLFGVICCLLCLLRNGGHDHVSDAAEISLSLLFGEDDGNTCTHNSLSPAELAETLWQTKVSYWSTTAAMGWQILLHIIREAEEGSGNQHGLLEPSSPDNLTDCGFHEYFDGGYVFGANERLGHIWAAAQTELLTYRRRSEDESWTSENFDMEALLQSLETKTAVSIPLIQKSMMRRYCPCGLFKDGWVECSYGVRREGAAAYYFSNLDDWARTSMLDDNVVAESNCECY